MQGQPTSEIGISKDSCAPRWPPKFLQVRTTSLCFLWGRSEPAAKRTIKSEFHSAEVTISWGTQRRLNLNPWDLVPWSTAMNFATSPRGFPDFHGTSDLHESDIHPFFQSSNLHQSTTSPSHHCYLLFDACVGYWRYIEVPSIHDSYMTGTDSCFASLRRLAAAEIGWGLPPSLSAVFSISQLRLRRGALGAVGGSHGIHGIHGVFSL